MSFLESDSLFYITVFLCYINLLADIALGYHIFVIVFGLFVLLMSNYVSNKTVVLFLSLILTNLIMMKYDKLTLLRDK